MGDNGLELSDDNYCFACGPANPIGLKLNFKKVGNEYIAEWTPKREHQGYVGITHGGIVATLLDEAITRFAWSEIGNSVTAELSVRYIKPTPIGKPITIIGRLESGKGRIMFGSAMIKDRNGDVLAEASAKVVKITH